jgi:hypothetical protein
MVLYLVQSAGSSLHLKISHVNFTENVCGPAPWNRSAFMFMCKNTYIVGHGSGCKQGVGSQRLQVEWDSILRVEVISRARSRSPHVRSSVTLNMLYKDFDTWT